MAAKHANDKCVNLGQDSREHTKLAVKHIQSASEARVQEDRLAWLYSALLTPLSKWQYSFYEIPRTHTGDQTPWLTWTRLSVVGLTSAAAAFVLGACVLRRSDVEAWLPLPSTVASRMLLGDRSLGLQGVARMAKVIDNGSAGMMMGIGAVIATRAISPIPDANEAPLLTDSFKAKRKMRFPPIYPNGWWPLCRVEEVRPNEVKTVSAMGQDFVLFRDLADHIAVLDAECCHVSAHLGDGRVVEGTLECCFHGWRFDGSGQCVHIPYCESPPACARVKSFPSRIWGNSVWIWLHADREEPTYELQHPSCSDGLKRRCSFRGTWDMHVLEMAENAPDSFHFNWVHIAAPIPIAHRFVTVHYDSAYFVPKNNSQERHISHFTLVSEIYIFGCKIPFFTTDTVVYFEGPSILHIEIRPRRAPDGVIHVIRSLLPLDDFKTLSDDQFYAHPMVPSWAVFLTACLSVGALMQDRPIWERHLYKPAPLTVKGDGSWSKHRAWWRQFYSESSETFGRPGHADW